MSSQTIQEVAVFATCTLSVLLLMAAVQGFALKHLVKWRLGHFLAVFFALRLGALVVIYLVYGFSHHGDLVAFSGYVAHLQAGKLPYLDFIIDYGIFFPHFLWAVTFGTGNILLMVVSFIVCDGLAFGLGDRFMAERASPQATAIYRILYTLCPISWFLVVGFGQEEPVLTVLGELTLLAALASWNVAAGGLVGIGLVLTKLMFGLYAFLAWLASRKKVVFAVIAVVVTGLLHYTYLSRGFVPIPGREYHNSPPSVNFWTVLWPVPPGSVVSLWVFPVMTVVVLLLTILFARRQLKDKPTWEEITLLVLANWLVFFIFSPKSLQPYRLVAIPFLFIYAGYRISVHKKFIYFFGAYSLALTVHYTFWDDWVADASYFASTNGVVVYLVLCVAVIAELAIWGDVMWRLVRGVRAAARSA